MTVHSLLPDGHVSPNRIPILLKRRLILRRLGWWGLRHRPTTPELRARAQLMEEGGPELWEQFMGELRHRHLGAPPPAGRPVSERLAEAYEQAVSSV